MRRNNAMIKSFGSSSAEQLAKLINEFSLEMQKIDTEVIATQTQVKEGWFYAFVFYIPK